LGESEIDKLRTIDSIQERVKVEVPHAQQLKSNLQKPN